MYKIVWLMLCGLLLSGMEVAATDNESTMTPMQHLEQGMALLHRGDYEAAAAELQQVLQLNPELQEAEEMLARIDAGAALRAKNFGAAEEAKRQGQHHLAARFYTKLLEQDALAGAHYPLFVTYYNRANSYLAQSDAFAAIKDYDWAIELNPRHISSYYNRGSAYSMLGKFELGIADYTKVIKLQPEHIAAYFNRGNAYASRREYGLAIADYERALELRPGWEVVEQNLREARSFDQIYSRFREGIAAEKSGAYDEAANIYSEVIDGGKLAPTNLATIYYARARIHMRKRDYASTINDLKLAVILHPHWEALQQTLQAVEREAAEIEQKQGKGALEAFLEPEQEPEGGGEQAGGSDEPVTSSTMDIPQIKE